MASYDLIIKAVDNTRTSFRNIERRLDRLDRKSKNVTVGFQGLGRAVALVGTALVTREIVQAAARFEDLNTTLRTVTGSAEAGADAFKFIRTFATQTQFGVEELTNTFIKLKASGIEPTRQLLTTFTDTAAVTTDQLGSLEAITDLLSRTTSGGLGLEELNRLADRGIPVFDILQKQIGVTRLEVSEFGKTAEGANQLVQALLTGLNQRFGGATANRLENLSTVLSNFRIALTNTLAAIGTGLAPAIKEITTSITDFLNANEGFAFTVGELLGKALLGVADAIGKIVEKIGLLEAGGLDTFAADITDSLANFIESFGTGLDSIVQTIGQAISGLQDLSATIAGLQGKTVIKLDANQTVSEFEAQLVKEIDQMKQRLDDDGFLGNLQLGFGPMMLPGLQKDIRDATFLLEQLRAGNAIVVRDMSSGFNKISQSMGPMVQGLRESAQSFRQNAEDAKNFNDTQTDITVTTPVVNEQLSAQEERLKALGVKYNELTGGIETANKAYQNNLPLIEQQKARYAEIRTLLGDLDIQLKENTNLTDEQKTAIQNATTALTAEKNELYERIKAGNYLYEVLNNTSDALAENRARHADLVSAIAQLEMQQNSEIFNNEVINAQLVALRAELVSNSEAYARLTGAVNNNNTALSASAQFYQDLVEGARRSVSELTYAAEAQKQLKADLDAGRISIDVYAQGMERINQILGITSGTVKSLDNDVQNLGRTMSESEKYFEGLLERANRSVNTLSYAATAQANLKQQLQEGKISLDVYAEAMKETNRVLGINTQQKDTNTKSTRANTQELVRAADILNKGAAAYKFNTAQSAENAKALSMLAQKYRSGGISLEEFRGLVQASGLDINNVKDDTVSMALTISESFKKAGDSLSRNLAAGLAKGKLSLNSFKDFFNQILDDILMAIIQKNITDPLVAQLTGALGGIGGAGGGGGFLGSLFGGMGGGGGGFGNFFGNIWSGITGFFGGLFADGGYLPSGKFGIAGEAGPEIIKGPADVVPMNQLNMGNGEGREPLTVNFNINAIDTKTGTEFLMQNKPQIIGMVSQAYNKQGRRGVIG